MALRATSKMPAGRGGKPQPTTLDSTSSAVCIELPAGGAPEWVELLPAGPEVPGRDGRRWRLDDAAAVAQASLDGARDLPIDWEHATSRKAPLGDPAPAAGWITRLEARNGALWGRVEWTDRGQAAVASREYRYLSPEFHYERSTSRIVRLLSAGLTNNPNLRLTALNQEGTEDMDIKEILRALGLSEDATAEQAVTAINTLRTERDTAKMERDTAQNQAENPSLEKFVPRADHNAALERATNAETKLAAAEKKAQEAEIETEITAALEAGKITPATADYHRAQCKAEGGLDRFKEYVKTAPAVAADSGLDGKQPGGGDKATALNADESRIAAMFGNTAEDLKKYGAAA